MKESNLKAKLGVALLLTVFSLNAIHAFNDYGVKENKLNYEVIAQSSSSGGGTTGGVKCRCGAVYGKGCKAIIQVLLVLQLRNNVGLITKIALID